MKDVIGKQVHGTEFYKYGLPYVGAGGSILSNMVDLLELMKLTLRNHLELHVVTRIREDRLVNRYVEENAISYRLFHGDPDPSIEFSGWCSSDYLNEPFSEKFKFIDLTKPETLSTIELAAINWALNSKAS